MTVRINNTTFPAQYLTTQEDIQKGMMFKDTLNGCMVFKLQKGHHSFWMKNCIIPLDIVFVLNNKITKIHHNCQPPHKNTLTPPKYTGIADTVIEFPANTCISQKIKINDNVYFF